MSAWQHMYDKNELRWPTNEWFKLVHDEMLGSALLFPTHILSQSITPAASALNLGVMFDENFNFKHHIENMSLFFTISAIFWPYSPVYITFRC